MDDAADSRADVSAAEERVRGEERLEEHAVNLSSVEAIGPALLLRASQSARKCECEGRRRVASAAISMCSACTHSTCGDCKARPDHRYVDDTTERLRPDQFEAEVKRVLPMRFTLDGFTTDALTAKFAELEAAGVPVDGTLKKSYLATLPAAIGQHEVRCLPRVLMDHSWD